MLILKEEEPFIFKKTLVSWANCQWLYRKEKRFDKRQWKRRPTKKKVKSKRNRYIYAFYDAICHILPNFPFAFSTVKQ